MKQRLKLLSNESFLSQLRSDETEIILAGNPHGFFPSADPSSAYQQQAKQLGAYILRSLFKAQMQLLGLDVHALAEKTGSEPGTWVTE
jgi:hypothetical protein